MLDFDAIGRLPAPADNCAIAIRTLPQGTSFAFENKTIWLSHTVLEGHRFAIRPIAVDELLLSWEMPFGRALVDIEPGDYVCNAGVLHALASRSLDFDLPGMPNFVDDLATFHFDPTQFVPAPPLPIQSSQRTFMGYRRAGGRGVGTRNSIVLLGVNTLVTGFVNQLEKRFKSSAESFDNIDGVVAVAHTEGSRAYANNHELLLRTLAGFAVHPNIGAVLIVDAGDTGVTGAMLREYMLANDYPLDAVEHSFLSLADSFANDLAQAETIVTNWFATVNEMSRSAESLGALKIALQCGGSDAFSGISGNPLVAWIAKEIIQYGGSANLAETDELIGAESYVLQKVRDSADAERFLAMVERFQERAGWHGHSAHGNPSGGNLYRGLYNIYLKSLGAATKRHPDVRLDEVIEYGERMTPPGYYFMDSPGNDLESIAGQVAAGCNLIYFVTGNGSITNFPFVPTIKVVTTSERYKLLSNEMDVNAGAYLDGQPLAELGQETLDSSIDVASGQRTVGEKAGHSQVQIWRDWQQTGTIDLASVQVTTQPDGKPFPIDTDVSVPDIQFIGWQTDKCVVSDRVGLVLPTSLCSGQVARLAVERLNRQVSNLYSRFVTLVHTEGCGGSTQREYVDTMLGYLDHPLVADCLLLEHGCETTHNDFWRSHMRRVGLDPEQFGWISIQQMGGIEHALDRIDSWFEQQSRSKAIPRRVASGLSGVKVGLVSSGDVDPVSAETFASLSQIIVAEGGSIVVQEHDRLLQQTTFTSFLPTVPSPTLAYAQQVEADGFHLMTSPSSNWSEMITGLGATGVAAIVACVGDRVQQGHPLIPVLQVGRDSAENRLQRSDFDWMLSSTAKNNARDILELLAKTLSQTYVPSTHANANVGFQITRGLFGVSL